MCDINEELRIFQDHVEECCKENSSLGEMKRDLLLTLFFTWLVVLVIHI